MVKKRNFLFFFISALVAVLIFVVIFLITSENILQSPGNKEVSINGIGSSLEKTNVQLKGSLAIIIIDDFENRISETVYYIQIEESDGLKEYQLIFKKGKEPGGISGQEIDAIGKLEGEKFFVEEYNLYTPLKDPNINIGAIGVQKTAVILYNDRTHKDERLTKEEVWHKVFNLSYNQSINSYIKEISYNKTWLEGDVFGVYTLPCDARKRDPPCYSGGWEGREAIMDIADPDIYFPNYSRIIAIPVNICCVGFSTIGKSIVQTEDGRVFLSYLKVGWADIDRGTGSHEFGHSLGVMHANDYECGEKVVEDNCETLEYGDGFDQMGQCFDIKHCGHFNPVHKEFLGFFDNFTLMKIEDDGIYRIVPYELLSNNLQVLKIPVTYILNWHENSSYFYLYYRQPIGFDSRYSNLSGVMINIDSTLVYYGRRDGKSRLLDFSPHSDNEVPQREDSNDVVLRKGERYVNDRYGFSIEVLEENGEYAEVSIQGL